MKKIGRLAMKALPFAIGVVAVGLGIFGVFHYTRVEQELSTSQNLLFLASCWGWIGGVIFLAFLTIWKIPLFRRYFKGETD